MISAHTRTLAIIGDPIEHSLTPRIQNVALQAIGADIVNVAFRVPSNRLENAVRGAQALGYLGLMVTIPHKEAVLALCDELHPTAQVMGAANLLCFREDGKIIGHSSDGWGAIKSLLEEGVTIKDRTVAVLGGGGAARSLALTFALEDASEVRVLNRTVAKAHAIAAEVEGHGVNVRSGVLSPAALEGVDLIVNTTSVGMTPKVDETPMPMDWLKPEVAVYDIVYNPLETRLLREARRIGARGIDGLGMLIYTNVYAVQVCAGVEVPAAIMREEAMKAFAERNA